MDMKKEKESGQGMERVRLPEDLTDRRRQIEIKKT